MLSFLIIYHALNTATLATISCTNYYSEEDTTGELVSAECASSDEELTSCGYIVTNTSRINRRGVQVSASKCKTLSEDYNGPVAGATAVARCCEYSAADTDCTGTAYSPIDGYDQTYNRSCAQQAEYAGFSTNYNHLLGCQGKSDEGTLDGFWFGDVRPDSISTYDTDIDYDPTTGTCNVWNGGTRGGRPQL